MASITPLKNGRFRVSYYDSDGVRHRPSFPTKKKAKEFYEETCANKFFEKTGLQQNHGKKANNYQKMKIRDLAKRYDEEHLSQSKAKGNVFYINKIIDKWGEWRLSQIAPEHVRPWLKTFLNKWEVSSVKKLATYFKRIFTWGCEEGIITNNPLKYLENKTLRKQFKKVNKRTKVISQEEFWHLEKCLPEWLRRVCVCTWTTGMRVGEVINLKWQNVNLVQRLIKLDSDETKEGDHKTIGIEQELYGLLILIQTERINIKPDELVFLSVKGGKICHHFLDRKFRKYADENGFGGLVIHDFRHCFVTRKRRAGHDKSVIKANTGHHTDSMFNWYNVVEDFEIQELAGYTEGSLNVLSDRISDVVETAKSNAIPLEAVHYLIGKKWRVNV